MHIHYLIEYCVLYFSPYAVLSGPMGSMGAALLSPDPRLNPAMNGGSGTKQPKNTSRSLSHQSSGGSQKKKSSPVPASHVGGSNPSKDHYVLVAAEAMPLSSAG